MKWTSGVASVKPASQQADSYKRNGIASMTHKAHIPAPDRSSILSLLLYYFIMRTMYYLSTDSVYTTCVRYNLRVLPHCQVCNCWLTNNISHNVYGLSPYHTPHAWLQCFISYSDQTDTGNVCTAVMLSFYSLQKLCLNKICIFHKIYCNSSFCDQEVSGIRVKLTSHSCICHVVTDDCRTLKHMAMRWPPMA
jgi:hypothetical protein